MNHNPSGFSRVSIGRTGGNIRDGFRAAHGRCSLFPGIVAQEHGGHKRHTQDNDPHGDPAMAPAIHAEPCVDPGDIKTRTKNGDTVARNHDPRRATPRFFHKPVRHQPHKGNVAQAAANPRDHVKGQDLEIVLRTAHQHDGAAHHHKPQGNGPAGSQALGYVAGDRHGKHVTRKIPGTDQPHAGIAQIKGRAHGGEQHA